MHYIGLFVAGLLLTIGTIERTIQAAKGNVMAAGVATLLVTLTTWFSITAAAEHDCLKYGAFAAGTVIATMATAYAHKQSP